MTVFEKPESFPQRCPSSSSSIGFLPRECDILWIASETAVTHYRLDPIEADWDGNGCGKRSRSSRYGKVAFLCLEDERCG